MKLANDSSNTEKTNYRYEMVSYVFVHNITLCHILSIYSYQTTTELIRRLGTLQQKYRSLLKFSEYLKQKIACSAQAKAVYLDEESEDYIKDVIASPESVAYTSRSCLMNHSSTYFGNSKCRLHASMHNSRGMRWHPLMIRWCLYLRHK